MSWYRTENGRPLGGGLQLPTGSVTDEDLVRTVRGYKRQVASGYRGINPDEITKILPPGPQHVTPKIDGELWYMVLDEGDVALVNPKGRVLVGNIPLLDEARPAAKKVVTRTIVAGELWAASKEGRPRVAGLATAMAGEANAQVKRLAFTPFDLVWGGDAEQQSPMEDWLDRMALLERLFGDGKRVRPVPSETVNSPDEVTGIYNARVEGGKAEGLVVRPADGRTYKIKPVIHIDAAVVGYTGRAEDPELCRSLLLALVREDGQFQLIGSVGNMGGDEGRRAMMKRVEPLATESTYRHASRDGALYRFVKPELVVQFRVNDIQSHDPLGDPVVRMVVEHDPENGWKAIRKMPGVSIYGPVLERVRDDKHVDEVDCRISQVLDRVLVSDLDNRAEVSVLDRSELLARDVYVKEAKGVLAVRKLLLWKTNKETSDPRYPAFVVQFTDYSPTRGEPLQKTVRPAPSLESAKALYESLKTKKKIISAKTGSLTRGWSQVEERSLVAE